ncbi:hypothetical protein LCGC14_0313110 [marine sediment metagenome]|uniref:Uncharacterized protein n=1 Tax=marine sediment metagenome TaxID=412755 RepID=A0A0F9TRT5_9ZZZZ
MSTRKKTDWHRFWDVVYSEFHLVLGGGILAASASLVPLREAGIPWAFALLFPLAFAGLFLGVAYRMAQMGTLERIARTDDEIAKLDRKLLEFRGW